MNATPSKTLLITGATDGIGLETVRTLASLGHRLLLHGRNPDKLKAVEEELKSRFPETQIETHQADFSHLQEVESLAKAVTADHEHLDALINNAGVFTTAEPITSEGLDVRFVVNTLAPYLLTQRLLPLLGKDGRVINLSSAAQAPVDLGALEGQSRLTDGLAYAQSKLALTQWSHHLATTVGETGPVIVAVNPGSFLGSKMVKEAYGSEGKDLRIGADILTRAALEDRFASASGTYFDNDSGRFASPHPDALDPEKGKQLVRAMEAILTSSLAD